MAKGKKTGGRQKGSLNKATKAIRAATVRATNSGMMPLEYMLKIMRNPRVPAPRRDWAAEKAAPYIHPKLATLQSNVNLTGRLTLEQLVEQSMPLPANENMKLIEADEDKTSAE